MANFNGNFSALREVVRQCRAPGSWVYLQGGIRQYFTHLGSILKWSEKTKVITFDGDREEVRELQADFWINRILLELRRLGDRDYDEVITRIVTDEIVGLNEK